MELILWRHADAEDVGLAGDEARKLTKRGRKQADRVARWLEPRLGKDWRIVSSPARRALETVEPMGRKFEVSGAVGAGAEAASVLREVGWPEGGASVLVVGHQPTLGELAARLLGARRGGMAVRKGAVWWFAARDGETVLRAVVDAELLEGPG
jgi:phosphohistidine phosphatase